MNAKTTTILLAASAALLALTACGGPEVDPADEALVTAEEALTTTGQVEVHLLADAVSGGQLVSTPVAGASVYDGDWHAVPALGVTDASGVYLATLTLGTHQLGVMKMTSSHSLLESVGNAVNVTTTRTRRDIHVAPTQVEIKTFTDVGYGNALYVTGETAYLGNWSTAYKLTYGNGAWDFLKNLPIGAQFKLIKAPWTSAATIAVTSAGVRWEQGPNHVIPAPYQSYQSYVQLSPTF